jgi:hypothetical protein
MSGVGAYAMEIKEVSDWDKSHGLQSIRHTSPTAPKIESRWRFSPVQPKGNKINFT